MGCVQHTPEGVLAARRPWVVTHEKGLMTLGPLTLAFTPLLTGRHTPPPQHPMLTYNTVLFCQMIYASRKLPST